MNFLLSSEICKNLALFILNMTVLHFKKQMLSIVVDGTANNIYIYIYNIPLYGDKIKTNYSICHTSTINIQMDVK